MRFFLSIIVHLSLCKPLTTVVNRASTSALFVSNMSRNNLPKAKSVSPLKTFLAAAASLAPVSREPQSRSCSMNPLALGTKGLHDAWARPEQDAWERNLMAITAMRGKLGGEYR